METDGIISGKMKNNKEEVAYWTQKTHLLRADEFICSGCGNVERKAHKICPSCGARMKKSKYDPTWVDEAEILDILIGD